jgi:hypothetical protein
VIGPQSIRPAVPPGVLIVAASRGRAGSVDQP